MTDSITVRLIPIEQINTILPLVQIVNPTVAADVLAQRLGEMAGQGYQCAGAYRDGQLVGICGLWVTTRFYCGKQLEPDNVVVDPALRSSGVGRAIMAWVYEYARAIGCEVCELNSYTANARSHKFYFNEGFSILGYHFQKPL